MTHSASIIEQSSPVSPASGTRLSLDVREASDRMFALAEWQSLETRLGSVPLMCSTDWTAAWLDAFGDLIPHSFVLARESSTENVVGACLVTRGVAQKDGPLPIRTLHLGTAGEPDADSVWVEYNDLLVEPAAREAFCEELRQYLQSQPKIDQWNLDGVSEELADYFDSSTQQLQRRVETSCWFDLTVPRKKGTRVLDELRSATRRKIKHCLKVASDVTVEWSESLDEATDMFSEMVDLHQAHWNSVGMPGCYVSDRFTRFHEALIARLIPEQRMAFVRVRALGRTVGCVQLFFDRDRALLYQCGRTLDSGVPSPGVLTDYLAMEACLDHGFDAYDFLPVETQHKRHLSNQSNSIVWAKRRHPRLKFAALNAARQLKRKLKPGDTKRES
ncbi:MAG: GNAT family N-acetyltransferase [Planctomycetota bacterium]|jgi:hypothetical protein